MSYRRAMTMTHCRYRAGSSLPRIGYSNSVNLETVPSDIHPTDASIVTYDLFRSAMLASSRPGT